MTRFQFVADCLGHATGVARQHGHPDSDIPEYVDDAVALLADGDRRRERGDQFSSAASAVPVDDAPITSTSYYVLND